MALQILRELNAEEKKVANTSRREFEALDSEEKLQEHNT
jgi:hypothetical protein